MLLKDIAHSFTTSCKRNGFWITISILCHYFILKFSSANQYSFFFPSLNHRVILRRLTSDFSVFRQICMNGEYDITFPIAPKIIIDAGANIGLASLHFYSRFPEAKIYALEPDAGNFVVLQKQVMDIPSIQTFKLALWNKRENLVLDSGGADAWGIQVRQPKAEEHNLVFGIDLLSFMIEQRIEIIDLLKIDVEGSEVELFTENFEYWLKRTKILVIELHENLRPGCERVFHNAIQSINHRIEYSGENIVVYNIDVL